MSSKRQQLLFIFSSLDVRIKFVPLGEVKIKIWVWSFVFWKGVRAWGKIFFLLKYFYCHWNIHLVWQIKYGKNMIRKLVTLILLVVIILIREQTIFLKPMSNTLEPSGYWNKSRNTRISCSQEDSRYRGAARACRVVRCARVVLERLWLPDVEVFSSMINLTPSWNA